MADVPPVIRWAEVDGTIHFWGGSIGAVDVACGTDSLSVLSPNLLTPLPDEWDSLREALADERVCGSCARVVADAFEMPDEYRSERVRTGIYVKGEQGEHG